MEEQVCIRRVSPAQYLRSEAERLLSRVEADGEHHYLDVMTAILLTAFSFEAFLNHAGVQIIEHSDGLDFLSAEKKWTGKGERLRFKEKLKWVCSQVEVSVDFARSPYREFEQLVRYRNSVVHGKLITRTVPIKGAWSDFSPVSTDATEPEWMRGTSIDNATSYLSAVVEIANAVCQKAEQKGVHITNALYVSDQSIW